MNKKNKWNSTAPIKDQTHGLVGNKECPNHQTMGHHLEIERVY